MDVILRKKKGVFVEKKVVKCKEYNNDRAQNQMDLSRHVCDILTSSKKKVF